MPRESKYIGTKGRDSNENYPVKFFQELHSV